MAQGRYSECLHKFKEVTLTFQREINWNPVFLTAHCSDIKQQQKKKKIVVLRKLEYKGKGLYLQIQGVQEGRKRVNPSNLHSLGEKKGQLRRDLIDNGLDNVK